jgi:hypothetical protein
VLPVLPVLPTIAELPGLAVLPVLAVLSVPDDGAALRAWLSELVPNAQEATRASPATATPNRPDLRRLLRIGQV